MKPLLAAVLLLAAGSADAASLRGRVSDDSGAPLPGVLVEAADAAGKTPKTARTDRSGAYELAGLEPGRYELSFRLAGFATSRRSVALDAGAKTLDVTLRLALAADVLVTGKRTFQNLADLDEPVNGLIGIAASASEGVVASKLLEARPVYRAGEVLEAVPGVVISQHSGEGKANQYYVRGFNIDHGTDLATRVAGVPVNLPTHAHGQGYSDLNFLIPELVAGVQYKKGPYYADEGDFSSAGAINVHYVNLLERPLAKLEGGDHGFGRALVAGSSGLGAGHLLYALELHHSDGPWITPDNYRRLNGVLRFSRGGQQDGLSVTAMGYSGRWNSTDQVPQRALASGVVPRFGAIDTSDGGRTHRLSLSGEWRRTTRAGLTRVEAYGFDYGLELYSNFTYFLRDPTNGDQFEQKDERRVAGLRASQRVLGRVAGKDVEGVFGAELRRDRIPTVGLYHTKARTRLATLREDDVTQSSGALFAQTSVQWTSRLRTLAGVRGDLYRFDVRSRTSGSAARSDAGLLSPKLSVVLGPWSDTELYANWGLGFHSNDGRGSPGRKDSLVRSHGTEVGLRTLALGRLHSTLSLWALDLDSELVFVGDAGTTRAGRPSRRTGFEWSNVWSARRWLTFDADLAWSRGRFRDRDPAGARIPGAIEGVASVGATIQDLGRFSGSLRLRYFGPRPLVEDDRVRSKSATTLNARAALRFHKRFTASLDVLNLANSAVSDVDYYYISRLPGEPREGIADVHTHPLQKRALRVGLSAAF